MSKNITASGMISHIGKSPTNSGGSLVNGSVLDSTLPLCSRNRSTRQSYVSL